MSTQHAWHVPEWTMGDRLRKAREDAGLSQAQLAVAIGISRNTVSNAELGDRRPGRSGAAGRAPAVSAGRASSAAIPS